MIRSIVDGSAAAVSTLSSSITAAHAPVPEISALPASESDPVSTPYWPVLEHDRLDKPQADAGQGYQGCLQHGITLYGASDLRGYRGRVWVVPDEKNAEAIYAARFEPVIGMAHFDRAQLETALRFYGATQADPVLAVDHTEAGLRLAQASGLAWLAPEKPGHCWHRQLKRARGMVQLRQQLTRSPMRQGQCPFPERPYTLRYVPPEALMLPDDTGEEAEETLPAVIRDYLGREKQLLLYYSWSQLQALTGLRLRTFWRNGEAVAILEWDLDDVQGQHRGSTEQIFPRGLLARWFPGRFQGKDNKKLIKGSKASQHFRVIGLASNADLAHYDGPLRLVGGLADALSCYLATGQPVVAIVGEGNADKIARLITETFPHLRGQLIVAPDHDPAGLAACQRVGTAWQMPERQGHDWNDVLTVQGLSALRYQLGQRPFDPVPAFEIDDPLRRQVVAVNYRAYPDMLNQYYACRTPEETVVMALAILKNHHRRVPHYLDEGQFLANLRHPLLHVDTWQQLRRQLAWLTEGDRNTLRQCDNINDTPSLSAVSHVMDPNWSPEELERQMQALPGVHCLKWPHGSGKSRFLAQLAKKLKAQGQKVLSLSHRKTLTREQARVFELGHYADLTPQEVVFLDGLVSCLPSLLSPTVAAFWQQSTSLQLLILDEFSKLLTQLCSWKICKGRGSALKDALVDVIQQTLHNGGSVFLADADLATAHLEAFREWFPDVPIHVWELPWQDEGKVMEYAAGPDAFLKVLDQLQVELVQRQPGECRLVPSDSCGAVKDIARRLKNAMPDLKVLAIDADNSGEPEQQAFINNADQALKEQGYEVVIFSPVIDSGVSIELPSVVATYGFFYNVLDPQEVMQQLPRGRACKRFVVALDIQSRTGEICDFMTYANAWRTLNVWEGRDRPVSDFSLFVAQTVAHRHRMTNLGGNGLIHLCELRQWTVKPMPEGRSLDELREDMNQIRRERREQNRKDILAARIIDTQECQTLNQQPTLGEADKRAVDRFQVCTFLGLPPEVLALTDVEFYERYRHHVERWLQASLDQDYEAKADPTRREAAFCQYHELCKIIYRYILEPLRPNGVLLESYGEKEAAQVLRRCQSVHKDKPFVLNVLGILPQSMVQGQTVRWPKHPMHLVNQILARLGLSVKRHQPRQPRPDDKAEDTTQKASTRRTEYRIQADSFQTMAYYAGQRARARELGVAQVAQSVYPSPELCQPDIPFACWLRTRCGTKDSPSSPKIVDPGVLAWLADYRGDDRPPGAPPGPPG